MSNRPNVADPGRIIAHRGASHVAPENSLLAIRTAERQGAFWVEFDVSLLGDGTAILHHDATLDRCSDATGPITDIGVNDLASISYGRGQRIPTLAQALDLIGELGMFANLEMKPHLEPQGRMAAIVAEALIERPWTMRRIQVSSFAHGELDALRGLMPDIPLAVLYGKVHADWPQIADRMNAAALHVRFDHLSSSLIDAARRRGLDLRTYTINDPDAARPFREAGLTGVITDHPPYFLEREDWRQWSED